MTCNFFGAEGPRFHLKYFQVQLGKNTALETEESLPINIELVGLIFWPELGNDLGLEVGKYKQLGNSGSCSSKKYSMPISESGSV